MIVVQLILLIKMRNLQTKAERRTALQNCWNSSALFCDNLSSSLITKDQNVGTLLHGTNIELVEESKTSKTQNFIIYFLKIRCLHSGHFSRIFSLNRSMFRGTVESRYAFTEVKLMENPLNKTTGIASFIRLNAKIFCDIVL